MKLRILLIDDDPQSHDRKTAWESVSKQQLSVDVVERLSEGLERLGCGGIDLVIVALSLPNEVIECLLKLLERVPTIPIIVLTNCDDEELAREAIKIGIQEYLLIGTFDERLLVRLIQSAVHRHAREQVAKDQLIQEKNRDSSCGRLVFSLTYEMKEPLAFIGLGTQLLSESLKGEREIPEEARQIILNEINVAVDLVHATIKEIRSIFCGIEEISDVHATVRRLHQCRPRHPLIVGGNYPLRNIFRDETKGTSFIELQRCS